MQVGADVPAESFDLSPVDRIFVRMGAKDNIMAGQSTFLTELSETATMLVRCLFEYSICITFNLVKHAYKNRLLIRLKVIFQALFLI